MTRIERRVLLNCVLVGALLTAVVVLLELTGWLQVPENWMYDLRARHFQYFSSPPTDQLVHLDIDDRALDGIGRWPWPRSVMADLIDELHRAKAKAIGLDILFADPQKPEYEPVAGDNPQRFYLVDHDARFAAAVKRAGNVLVPASFKLDEPTADPLYAAVLHELLNDVELSESEVLGRVRSQLPADATLESRLTDVYLNVRTEAVYRRIEAETSAATLSPVELRQKLIKRRDASVNSPLSRLIEDERRRHEAVVRLMQFGLNTPATTDRFIPGEMNLPPIIALGNTIAATAFVDFTPTSRDGVLRTQPLMIEYQGKLFPQMGLSLALLYLGATPRDLTFTPQTLSIACPDGRSIILPTDRIYSETLGRKVPGIFNVPWFGKREWETMYDWPDHRQSRQHLSMNAVWEPVLTTQKIIRDNLNARKALAIVVDHLSLRRPPESADDDPDANAAYIDDALAQAKDEYEFDKQLDPKDSNDDLREFVKAVDILRTILKERALLKQQLVEQRAALTTALGKKAILVGFTATGNQDAVPTSLHPRSPGVLTHGVIFNAIVTGRFWTVAPEWITILFTIALGWMTAVIAWRFSPLGAFLITSAFGMSYVALNGLFFFDHMGQIIGLAAPQFAMAGVWSGCSLARIIIESSERQRIIRRFRSYVDPTVVNYMMERPDEVRMEGETRELTVCFSDIAGFTPLSEKLGDGIVPVLNEFMDLMVPIIRGQHGTVDKFLGDGIMYFFGAPVPNTNHAADAVAAALLMQQSIGRFDQELIDRGLPTVAVRIGMNTGLMVVGDAGSKDAADYTVLGDNVNFASRLESANKQLGTAILLSARTAELAGDRFLLRPVGALQVVGKTEGVLTYTVSGLIDGADPRELKLCELTQRMVSQFRQKDFSNALATVHELETAFGTTTLTDIYFRLCRQYLLVPPAEPFDGEIVFTEK